jgi:hypothetical protein
MSPGRILLGMSAACVWLGGCSLVLDFPELPPRDGGADANAAACAELEPNDELAAPSAITPGAFSLAICPTGDLDFFRFEVAGGQDVTIDLSFQNGGEDGDLDLRLYRESDGAVISVSDGFDAAGEQITQTAADGDQLTAGMYVIEVYPFAETIQNEYSLTLAIGGVTPDAGP